MTKNDLLKKVLPHVIVIAIYTFLIVWFFENILFITHNSKIKNISSLYSILGFVISLLLAFRTNTAYDRWWEGRKALGSLVNYTRMLAIRFASIFSTDISTKKQFATLINSFVFTLKDKLQGLDNHDASHLDFNLESKQPQPLHCIYEINLSLEKLKVANKISEIQYLSLMPLLTELSNVVGICERIKNTPIPYSYSSFIKKFIFIYTYTLPFAWILDFKYYTIIAVAFVFYVLVSMEMLAEEIENPFGLDENDLPFDDIAKKIQQNINDILLSKEALD